MAYTSNLDLGINKQPKIYDILYLFLIFVIPFMGYVSSIIYKIDESDDWFKEKKFKLIDLVSNANSYNLFFTLIINSFCGLAIVFISDHYLQLTGYESSDNKTFKSLGKIWEAITLLALPTGLFLLWISIPIMNQYQTLVFPGIMAIASTVLFTVTTVSVSRISWTIVALLLPLCFWSCYLSIFYFTSGDEEKDNPNVLSINQPDDNITTPTAPLLGN